MLTHESHPGRAAELPAQNCTAELENLGTDQSMGAKAHPGALQSEVCCDLPSGWGGFPILPVPWSRETCGKVCLVFMPQPLSRITQLCPTAPQIELWGRYGAVQCWVWPLLAATPSCPRSGVGPVRHRRPRLRAGVCQRPGDIQVRLQGRLQPQQRRQDLHRYVRDQRGQRGQHRDAVLRDGRKANPALTSQNHFQNIAVISCWVFFD